MKIGIFDSGVGGITILSEVMLQVGGAQVVYLCDNKNLPYGGKSVEFIKNRLNTILNYFHSQNCSIVFIACHSAASVYLKHSNQIETYGIRVIDVISPTCRHLRGLSMSSIGIMATDRTISDRTYNQILDPPHRVMEFPSGNLATLIEGYHIENSDAGVAAIASKPVVEAFLQEILCESRLKMISKMILACTHYPHVIDSIKDWISQHTSACQVIDPASIVVTSAGFDSKGVDVLSGAGNVEFFTTGDSASFKAFCKNSAVMKNSGILNYSIKQIVV